MEQLRINRPRGYRSAVAIILANSSGKVLLARRNDMENQWQLPQGGVDLGEDPKDAMYRELREELNVTEPLVRVLGFTKSPHRYDFPEKIVEPNNLTRTYVGQELVFFLLKFLGKDSMIDVCGVEHPEFDCWTWVDYWTPAQMVVDFKRDVYQRALVELEPRMQVKDL